MTLQDLLCLLSRSIRATTNQTHQNYSNHYFDYYLFIIITIPSVYLYSH